MGNAHAAQCVPLTSGQDENNNIPGLMKRTCQRMSLRRIKISLPSQQSSSHRKKNVLKAMPRCSSFEDISSILSSSKKIDIDPIYMLWKKSFEYPRDKPDSVKQDQLKRMKRRVHNMTSVISGHITPKGFPSYIKLKAFNIENPPKISLKQKQYIRKKPLQLPQPNGGSLVNHKIHLIPSNRKKSSSQYQNISPYQPSLIAFVQKNIPDSNSKVSTQSKRSLSSSNMLSKFSQNKQALIIEKLFRNIKKFESYYDSKMDSFIF